MEQKIDAFIDHYQAVFNKALNGASPDLALTADLFSSCFIAASPAGVNCGRNDESFAEAIRKGYGFYRQIGITSMEIISKEIMILNELHAMAKVRWRSNFLKNDNQKGSVEFENIYFIQSMNSQYKIFAYITGDEQAALKEAGLI